MVGLYHVATARTNRTYESNAQSNSKLHVIVDCMIIFLYEYRYSEIYAIKIVSLYMERF